MASKPRWHVYAGQRKKRRVRWILPGILLILLSCTLLTSLFFSVRVLESNAMLPNLHAGDRIVFSSYVFNTLLHGIGSESSGLLLRRGSIVLLDMFGESPKLYLKILDSFVRFFTAQRISFTERPESLFVKRIIGLPGDEITMSNFVIRVRANGSAYDLTEFEVTDLHYTLNLPQLPGLWDSSLPFSGSMDRIVLGDHEFFVLSDDRSNTNDSRSWGPVHAKNISGNALFRYWPLGAIGRF